ncbi:hypothetical protein ACKKBG_A25685 [Auxenochlorella protothecoides x Auxenochlorella symbiontica]
MSLRIASSASTRPGFSVLHATLRLPSRGGIRSLGITHPTPRQRHVGARAELGGGTDSKLQLAAGVAGVFAAPLVLWSSYTLATTGSGLPPGPSGVLGAAEGLSYLVVTAMVAWSVKTKISSGSGLPAGPYGLVGAAEGLSFLAIAAGIIAFAVKTVNS